MSLTPEEATRLRELEAEAAERAEAQQKAESARLDEITDALREGGYPDAADRVFNMTNLGQFFDAYRGPLRRDIRDSNLELADELDEERDELIASRAAEEVARRKEEEEVRAKAEQERQAAMSSEELEAEAAAEQADAAEQAREDALQKLVVQTDVALQDSGDFTRDAYNRARRTGVLTPMPVQHDAEGNVVLDASGHAIPVPFRKPFAKAVEEGPMFQIKRLADELVGLPSALRGEWWGQRSEVERHALERGFGLRAPITKAEVTDGND
jgi:hypothetical protein